MVEKPSRARLSERDAPDGTREWEVFVRDESDDALRHVGRITAPSAEDAHERASRLFGWYAESIWLCPATEVARYSTHDLDDERDPIDQDGEAESRTTEL
jgi:rSAM-partnered protein